MRRLRACGVATGVTTTILVVSTLVAASPLPPSLTAVAAALVLECISIDTQQRNDCYREKLPDLLVTRTPAELFAIVDAGQRFDPALVDCHFIAHRIGERVASDDPSRWNEHIRGESASALCSYGFLHGVAIAAFADGMSEEQVLTAMPSFRSACVSEREIVRSGCIHALGHMFYYVADSDVARALRYCEIVTDGGDGTGNDARRCFTGVLMLLFVSLHDPDWDGPLTGITRENARAYCASLGKTEWEGACRRASWPLFREVVIREGGIDEFCQDEKNEPETAWCYAKVSIALGWTFVNDPDRIGALCAAVSAGRRDDCFTHVIYEYLAEGGYHAIPKAERVCAAAPETAQEGCHSEIAWAGTFFSEPGSRERRRFCGAAASDDIQSCLAAPSR